MKTEDYLWDKTGEDPEIEKLENALSVFRYKETAPPELPAKVLPFTTKKETPRSFFRFAYAAAACVAFFAIALGVWFQVSNNKIDVAEIPAEITAPVAVENKITDDVSAKDSVEPSVVAPKQIAKREVVKVKKQVYKIKAAPRVVKVQPETVALTSEEKYAYNQLMLALSITGAKLRLVSEKIEGTEKGN
jgi:hypothetical protein